MTSPTVDSVRDALKAAAVRALAVRTAAERVATELRAERDAQTSQDAPATPGNQG